MFILSLVKFLSSELVYLHEKSIPDFRIGLNVPSRATEIVILRGPPNSGSQRLGRTAWRVGESGPSAMWRQRQQQQPRGPATEVGHGRRGREVDETDRQAGGQVGETGEASDLHTFVGTGGEDPPSCHYDQPLFPIYLIKRRSEHPQNGHQRTRHQGTGFTDSCIWTFAIFVYCSAVATSPQFGKRSFQAPSSFAIP